MKLSTEVPLAAAARAVAASCVSVHNTRAPGMAQDVGDLFRLQHEVDRHEHRPRPGDREAHRHERMRISGEQRDLVADADSLADQGHTKLVADRIELCIGPPETSPQMIAVFVG